jgi:hypothetical protein
VKATWTVEPEGTYISWQCAGSPPTAFAQVKAGYLHALFAEEVPAGVTVIKGRWDGPFFKRGHWEEE